MKTAIKFASIFFLAIVLFLFSVVEFANHFGNTALPPVQQHKQSAVKKVSVKTGSIDNIQTLHDAVYHIEQRNVEMIAGCTGTAIGPHAIITASHCEKGSDILYVGDTQKTKAHIVKALHDEHDHTIFLLSGVEFGAVASFAHEDLHQGQKVFMWGNPDDLRDMYREGYVVGTEKADKKVEGSLPSILFDMPVDHGDSGSALFDKDGELVGVLSFRENSAVGFAGVYALAFTPEQIKRAQTF